MGRSGQPEAGAGRAAWEYANARVELGHHPGLARGVEFRAGDWQVRLSGRPGWLVDYGRLAYEAQPGAVEEALEELCSAWLADPGQAHRLARLSGEFVILAGRGGRLERLVASDELPNTVYWQSRSGRVELFDHLWPRLAQLGAADASAWSREDLAYLNRKKTCRPGRTLFTGLGRLMAGTAYRVDGERLVAERAVIPHKAPGPKLGHSELLNVIGRRLPAGPHALAYSSGIDSHHLLVSQAQRIGQVCNISYAPPYQDPERSLEAAAALANTAALGRGLTVVQADFTDPMNRAYLEHAVGEDPFACHLNFSMYQMLSQVRCPRVLSGQNADTVQWFGLTSTIPWQRGFFTSRLANYPSDWHRLYYRWQVARSYGRLCGPALLDRRLFYGQWARVGRLVERRGYWPILYFKRINNMTSGNTQLFRNAARYFDKAVDFPYLEPLALYVSAYWQRPLASLRDPKAGLRALHAGRLDHRDLGLAVAPGLGFDQSPMFGELAEELGRAAPELKAHVDRFVSEPMARGFTYALALKAAGPAPDPGGD